MLVWSAAAILEKNKLASDAPFLILIEMKHNKIDEVIRLVRNTEEIFWNGNIYLPFPIDFDTYTEDGKTLPKLNLKISNAIGTIQTYIQKYNGFTDGEIKIMVVHADHLDIVIPEYELNFLITETKYNEEWITFVLGASSEMVNRFPQSRYMTNYCPYKFKSIKCGYNGDLPACNNTLEQCRIPKRFGGEPGMQTGR